MQAPKEGKQADKGMGLEPNLRANLGKAGSYAQDCRTAPAGSRKAQSPEESPLDGGFKTNGITPKGSGI